MEQVPTPASPKIPASQLEAQETVNHYMLDTINALPRGAALDGTRYVPVSRTIHCEDDPSENDPPVHLEDWRDMTFPPGTDFNAVINETGEIWKSWGWQVLERDGFDKPNRFGYAPDGYVLQISARPDPTQPPSLIASSPCFPESRRDSDVKKIPVISQTP